MFENLIENTTDKVRKVAEPVNKLNALILQSIGKVAEFQFAAARGYGDMVMQQVRGLAEIRDADSLTKYANGQVELATEMSKKFLEDMKTLGDIGSEFRSEVEAIIKKARTESKPAVAATPRKAEKAVKAEVVAG